MSNLRWNRHLTVLDEWHCPCLEQRYLASVVDHKSRWLRGRFEVRWWPNKYPAEVKRLFGHADEGIGGWYVVINNGGGIDAPWQWGLGMSWVHPNSVVHGTFEQTLTPLDEAACRVLAIVRDGQAKVDAECEAYARHSRAAGREPALITAKEMPK